MDKKMMSRPKRQGRSRMVVEDEDSDLNQEDNDEESPLFDKPTACRVGVVQSPSFNAYYGPHIVRLTLDTGATTNMIKASFAKYINLPITKASQMARQADGVTPLEVLGEVHCTLTRGTLNFTLDALVVDQLDVDVLAGTLFLSDNDIATRPAKKQIVINGTDVIYYGPRKSVHPTARRAQTFLLRSPPNKSVILPGQFVEFTTPSDAARDEAWALEPRWDCALNLKSTPRTAWPLPQEIVAVDNKIRLTNSTPEPILLHKHEHVCQVHPILHVDGTLNQQLSMEQKTPITTGRFSETVCLDPDNSLAPDIIQKFKDVNSTYDSVFYTSIPKYNGASGAIEAIVNIGPTVPPQRKGRLPQYNKASLSELQQKFDDLEKEGVFAKPEDVGICVEYLNISFLVKKPQGGSRLVTSFGEVANYCKPQPSLMPSVDTVLRDIASWKYIIVTDLLKSFYQIPLAKASMKYCGVATPYKGIRVYTRCAMGMPGSETCLEELMSRVLGDLIQEGRVAKLADDLYCGGNSIPELLDNWSRLLSALKKNNLRLSAKKTIICPISTTILGWIWSAGTLKASPHRVATLAAVDPPTTVQGLRSFIGAYKVLSRVLPRYASLLHPLDQTVAGRKSQERIDWSDELTHAFKQAQSALKDNKVIHLPRPDDVLWIVTDGSVKNRGIGATMYALRADKLLLAGFFNAKLRAHQVNWLPCEVEALCVGSAIKHFSPYIVQSHHRCQVLTDSRPCVLAYGKLQHGHFSASSRVTSFLSTLSRYHIQVQHIAGAANLPSDFASRNPQTCVNQSCQLCKFIAEMEDSVVLSLSVKDVLDGSTSFMPFTSRVAWLATQHECPDLRRTHAQLTQGTRPSKKATKIPDVKRYLHVASVARDGLLIVKEELPFSRSRERIIVPKPIVDGLLTALHFKFQHPTQHQLKKLFTRYFYAINADNCIQRVTAACHHCTALKTIPAHFRPQSTSAPPDCIGSSFAADVIRRCKQCIFVLRETVSSFTLTAIIPDERHDTLRDTIILLCCNTQFVGGHNISIRVDPAPGFVAIQNDSILQKYGISLTIGQAKNINKNPVAERAIEELCMEFLNLSPQGGPISPLTLALATSTLNSRVRHCGLSALEVWTQRDQISGDQLPINDRHLILRQHENRVNNHTASAWAKSKKKDTSSDSSHPVCVGDLVYLKCDKDKTKARDKYMVVSVAPPWCTVRKFCQSQFRSKSYNVRSSDCYPVMPTVPAHSKTGPIRGLEGTDSSEDEEPEGRPTIPAQPAPNNIDRQNSSEGEPEPAVPLAPEAIIRPPDPAAPLTRHSSRPHKPPPWMVTGEWNLND
jgi:hypothetical protein